MCISGMGYYRAGANFCEKPVMSLRSNFRGSNFRGDSSALAPTTWVEKNRGWKFS